MFLREKGSLLEAKSMPNSHGRIAGTFVKPLVTGKKNRMHKKKEEPWCLSHTIWGNISQNFSDSFLLPEYRDRLVSYSFFSVKTGIKMPLKLNTETPIPLTPAPKQLPLTLIPGGNLLLPLTPKNERVSALPCIWSGPDSDQSRAPIDVVPENRAPTCVRMNFSGEFREIGITEGKNEDNENEAIRKSLR